MNNFINFDNRCQQTVNVTSCNWKKPDTWQKQIQLELNQNTAAKPLE